MGSKAKLKTIIAIATTSVMESRLAMRHRWWQSSGSIDLDHMRQPAAPYDRLCISNLKDLLPPRRVEDFAKWVEALRKAGLPE